MSTNPFIYTIDNKRYHTLNFYNRKKYGKKVFKASIDGGFTCPNIDGTKGIGGCIFCDAGSGYFTKGNITVKQQLESEINRIRLKYGKDTMITAYFQSNTNTYADIDTLVDLWNTVLEDDRVQGISIGTRGDCLQENILNALSELNQRTNLTVELGLQSIHPSTIDLINRCCTHEEILNSYHNLKSHGIRVCLHIINGLPYETSDMMIETVNQIAKLKPDAVKIQMLHVIKGTELETMYNSEPFHILTKDEYIDIVIKQLELLPPETVIERITGDGDKSKLIVPEWSKDKISVLGEIDRRMTELDTWQGKYYFSEKL
jgi:hypothetical protein